MNVIELIDIINYSKSKNRKYAFCQIGVNEFQNLQTQMSDYPLDKETFIARSNISDASEKMVVFRGFTTFFKLQ